MNNILVLFGVVSFLGVIAGMLGLFFTGRKATLCEAKVGEVYNFEYLQPLNGERKRWLAKVVEPVAQLTDDQIARLNRNSYRKNDPEFKRSNHLVTCETKNGDIRQFYCERAVNCRKPLLGRIM